MYATYAKGTDLVFVCSEPTTFRGRRYRKNDSLTITLSRQWNESEGIARGDTPLGPWGWGGYSNEFLESIALAEEAHSRHYEDEERERCKDCGSLLTLDGKPCGVCAEIDKGLARLSEKR